MDMRERERESKEEGFDSPIDVDPFLSSNQHWIGRVCYCQDWRERFLDRGLKERKVGFVHALQLASHASRS